VTIVTGRTAVTLAAAGLLLAGCAAGPAPGRSAPGAAALVPVVARQATVPAAVDHGLAASPRGTRGGVGPGVVGNFIVTGHRTAAGAPLRRLPDLQVGAHVLVRSGSSVFDYVVTATMSVSFRSAASMALQTAAVPGHPGRPATQPMVTLSTCATPEDHAQGNWWRDALGNPEHRIDKVGVLVAVRPV